jgi:hypothetical protein
MKRTQGAVWEARGGRLAESSSERMTSGWKSAVAAFANRTDTISRAGVTP